MSQLGDLAKTAISPILKLVGSTAPPYLAQSIILANHCLELLKHKFREKQYIKFSHIKDAISSTESAVLAASNLDFEIAEIDNEVELLFAKARDAVEILYRLLHPGVNIEAQEARDRFIEEFSDAKERDKQSCERRRLVAKRRPRATKLTETLEKVAMYVRISVSRSLFVRDRGIRERYHENLRLDGLLYKLHDENIIKWDRDVARFYVRGKTKHGLTPEGVTFEALEQNSDQLKLVKKKSAGPHTEVLELFVAVAPCREDLAVVTTSCITEGGQVDLGVVITKNNGVPAPRSLGQKCDLYQNVKTKRSIRHKDMQWGELWKKQWLLVLQRTPPMRPFASLEEWETTAAPKSQESTILPPRSLAPSSLNSSAVNPTVRSTAAQSTVTARTDDSLRPLHFTNALRPGVRIGTNLDPSPPVSPPTPESEDGSSAKPAPPQPNLMPAWPHPLATQTSHMQSFGAAAKLPIPISAAEPTRRSSLRQDPASTATPQTPVREVGTSGGSDLSGSSTFPSPIPTTGGFSALVSKTGTSGVFSSNRSFTSPTSGSPTTSLSRKAVQLGSSGLGRSSASSASVIPTATFATSVGNVVGSSESFSPSQSSILPVTLTQTTTLLNPVSKVDSIPSGSSISPAPLSIPVSDARPLGGPSLSEPSTSSASIALTNTPPASVSTSVVTGASQPSIPSAPITPKVVPPSEEPEEVDHSWGGWLKKKVVPKVTGYFR
ncbi:hypothetical protein FRB93_004237 [Tulasnella sp. JGI-2019a]|nr:hypothetical protein FRB93_004237 [Tulasnella sp. JGI-2019a]